MFLPLGSNSPSLLDYSQSAFWVQINNVPLNFLTPAMAHELGSVLGTVEEVFGEGCGDWIGSVIRIRVILDVTKPLRRVVR